MMRAQISSNRLAYLLLALLVLLASVPVGILEAKAANDDADTSRFDYSVTNNGPRELEDQTQNAIERQYAGAWKNMAQALADNRPDLVDQNFVGGERDQLRRQIEQQKKNGLSTKLNDASHKVEFVFYSPEGTAIELHDTVVLSQQTLDGSKQIHSDNLTRKYVVVFTLVEDKWKVRMLQEIQ